MVVKLKSRTLLRPLFSTSPLSSRGVSECLSDYANWVIYSSPKAQSLKGIFRNIVAVANSAITWWQILTSRFPLRSPTYIIKHGGANQIATHLPRHCSGPACSQLASQLEWACSLRSPPTDS